MNDLAGEPIARGHHGSLAAAQRSEIEELLKAGKIKALVATSSLELGIDMVPSIWSFKLRPRRVLQAGCSA